jgi:DNA topoisomerase-1
LKEIYGVATVDGRKENLGNWTIEPPGLFLGRGNHPKAGMIKHRVQPEDVTLNLSKDAKVPDAPEGHKWGSIVHDNTVAWIATWKENIKGDNKYVLFAPSSSIRSNKDREKFETARRLKNCVNKIRKQVEVDLTSKDEMIRQRATAVWIIDRLALRVGNEKNKDEEADTVGCCSLRVEHIKLHPPTTVEFEFLGKDSMRYHNSVQVDEQVFKNLQTFCKSKKPDEDIFDRLTTHSVNRYLSEQMEGLTAKVFRTYNASITLERELGKLDEKKLAKMTPEQKLIAFNDANRQVAILCNHQKTVAKNINEQMQRIDDKINELKEQRKELKDHLKSSNGGGSEKKGKKRKRDESSSESSDEDKSPKKKAKKGDGEDTPKKKKLPTDPEKIKVAIEKIEARIKATELRKQDKDANKEIALGTSKTNYIDPRIVIAWCKKMNLSINKVFTKTNREKFPWAFDEIEKDADYEF